MCAFVTLVSLNLTGKLSDFQKLFVSGGLCIVFQISMGNKF